MANKKVGTSYVFDPVLIDRCNPQTSLVSGDVVVVVERANCPKANTAGHCYVSKDDVFQGLVNNNSLIPLAEWEVQHKEVLRIQAEQEEYRRENPVKWR